MNVNNTYSVLTPASTGQDVSVYGNILSITGAPSIPIPMMLDPIVGWFTNPVAEVCAIWSIVAVASPTAGLLTGFLMKQYTMGTRSAIPNTGVPLNYMQNVITAMPSYVVQTGNDDDTVALNLNYALTAYKDPALGFHYTNSVSTTTITLTASAGYPILEVVDISNPTNALTITNGLTNLTSVTSNGSTPDLITKSTHGLVSGQRITISSMATDTNANGTWTVDVVNSNTFYIRNAAGQRVAGSGTAGTGGVVQFLMTASRGTVNDLLHAGVNASYLTTGHVYGTFTFNWNEEVQSGVLPSVHLRTHTVYVDYTANTTYYASFVTALAAALGTSLYIS